MDYKHNSREIVLLYPWSHERWQSSPSPYWDIIWTIFCVTWDSFWMKKSFVSRQLQIRTRPDSVGKQFWLSENVINLNKNCIWSARLNRAKNIVSSTVSIQFTWEIKARACRMWLDQFYNRNVCKTLYHFVVYRNRHCFEGQSRFHSS